MKSFHYGSFVFALFTFRHYFFFDPNMDLVPESIRNWKLIKISD